jgi:hypothetical protein
MIRVVGGWLAAGRGGKSDLHGDTAAFLNLKLGTICDSDKRDLLAIAVDHGT